MKNIKLMILTMLLCHQSAYGQIYNLSTGQESSVEELSHQGKMFIFGEYHYNSKIQNEEARLMSEIVKFRALESQFDFGWEFLNSNEGELVKKSYKSLLTGDINSSEFLDLLLGSNPDNKNYEVLVDTLKKDRGNLIPLNLSRDIKRQVSRGGIEALDPEYMPEDFQMGSEDYYDRFIEAMGGHGGEMVDNYFAAQSLVDNIMAETILANRKHELSFLICGSFHSDYNDGVVAELLRRGNLSITTVKFIDRNGMSDKEIEDLLFHEHYGRIADYAVIIP